jgi:hypothetical protein
MTRLVSGRAEFRASSSGMFSPMFRKLRGAFS